jgi:hypothetical protein
MLREISRQKQPLPIILLDLPLFHIRSVFHNRVISFTLLFYFSQVSNSSCIDFKNKIECFNGHKSGRSGKFDLVNGLLNNLLERFIAACRKSRYLLFLPLKDRKVLNEQCQHFNNYNVSINNYLF